MAQGTSSIAGAFPDCPGRSRPPVSINPGLPSRDIAWVPSSNLGPLLASVDARDDAVSLYAWRDGGFARVGFLPTGRLPAQVIAADLDGSGWDDLIVRNAGDGTLSIFLNDGPGVLGDRLQPGLFQPPITLDVGLARLRRERIQAMDTDGDGLARPARHRQARRRGRRPAATWGDGVLRVGRAWYRAGTGLSVVTSDAESTTSRPWRRPQASPPAGSRPGDQPAW